MANTLLNPTQVARTGLALLKRELILPNLFNRSFEADFAGAVGDTVNVRVPMKIGVKELATEGTAQVAGTLTARPHTAGAAITMDDIVEVSVPVVLGSQLYSAVKVTDEDLSLKLVDFGSQVLQPQTAAVASGAEARVATVLAAITGGQVSVTSANFKAKLVTARRVLNQANVPMDRRVFVMGPLMEELALNADATVITPLAQSGDATPLREAIVGRVAGFTLVTSNAIDETTGAMGYAAQADSVAFVTKAPAVPDGVPFGQSVAEGGFALRWIRDYDASTLSDRSVVSVFAGAKVVDASRLVRVTAAAT